MQPDLPTFAQLRRRYVEPDDDPPTEVTVLLPPTNTQSLGRLVVDYLATLGVSARSLDQLYSIISHLEDDDLTAFRTCEGVAVTAASDGWWVLFVDGEPT